MAYYLPNGGMSLWWGAPLFWSRPIEQKISQDIQALLAQNSTVRYTGSTVYSTLFQIYVGPYGGDLKVTFESAFRNISTTYTYTFYVRIINGRGEVLYTYSKSVFKSTTEEITHDVTLQNVKPRDYLRIQAKTSSSSGAYVYIRNVAVYGDRLGPVIEEVSGSVTTWPTPDSSTSNSGTANDNEVQLPPIREYAPGISNPKEGIYAI